MTTAEVVAQGFVFFLAAHETTSSTLQYLTYLLAVNPDKQDKQGVVDVLINFVSLLCILNKSLLKRERERVFGLSYSWIKILGRNLFLQSVLAIKKN